jgi:ATP-dependent RNA helicase DeaD
VAAALIRLYRSRLPEPEELSDDIRDHRPGPREPREPREPRPYNPMGGEVFGGGDMAWFRLTIGRRANADPKWLIPLICRMGHVTKKDIGAIRIFDHETKFEISRERETSFREAVKSAGDAKGPRIEPTNAPGPKQPRRDDDAPPEHRPPRKDFKPPRGPKPKPRG